MVFFYDDELECRDIRWPKHGFTYFFSNPVKGKYIVRKGIYNQGMFRNLNGNLQSSGNYILGINIDSERILIVYGSASGMVSEKLTFPAPRNENFQYFLSEVSSQADKLLMITQAQRLPLPDTVSVSVCGNLDNQSNILTSAADFPQWKNESLRSQLSLRFNLPVYVECKAYAGLLAELLFGDLNKRDRVLYINFSPRIRVGILSGGQLYNNAGGNTGALGNCQVRDPRFADSDQFKVLNDFASGSGLLKFAKFLHPAHWEDDLSQQSLIQSALDQDPYAIEVVQEAASLFGRELENLIHVLRPETLITGSPFHLLGDLWLKPMTSSLSLATGLGQGQLPEIISSSLNNRQPELESLAPAIASLRGQNGNSATN